MPLLLFFWCLSIGIAAPQSTSPHPAINDPKMLSLALLQSLDRGPSSLSAMNEINIPVKPMEDKKIGSIQ